MKTAIQKAIQDEGYAIKHEMDQRQKDRREGFREALEWVLSIYSPIDLL